MKARSLALALACTAFAALPATVMAQATAPTVTPAANTDVLVVGDLAPKIDVETFIKGDPVKGFTKGKPYILEFWATWCGPCRKAFPHLSSIQKEYKDKGLTVIGVDVWEEGGASGKGYTPETLEKVRTFVQQQGDKMAYTVAYDGGAGRMTKTYMEAAGQDGIPASFVINGEGRIAWIGNPHDPEFDAVVKAVVDGTHVIDEVAASKAREDAAKRITSKGKFQSFARAVNTGEHEAALKLADEIAAIGGPYASQAAAWKYNYLLTEKNDPAAAGAFGSTLVTGLAKDDAMLLNQIAWGMVDPDAGVEKPDLGMALAAAARAVEITKGKDGAILDTLARVYWLKGDKAKAIATQKDAVANAQGEMKKQLEGVLKEYETSK